ncbi:thymidylate kinase [Candidatus Daviesbacteria bacterium]|nr:thymidylate kinase [Candidatus Daviesbacteria bacterium]
MNQVKKRGYFIVIDGTDGSGKATQIKLLTNSFRQKGIDFETIDFPRYEDNVYGMLIGRYLSGEFGRVDDVNPYLMSLAFAGDRKVAAPKIKKWLDQGKLVITNRYVSSNKAHMGANLSSKERPAFLKWLEELEYKTNEVPKEDLTILLHVDSRLGQQNVDSKHTRNHLKDVKRDIHEASLKHLEEANRIYLELSKTDPSWIVIECMANGSMKSPDKIHDEITEVLQKKAKFLLEKVSLTN